MTRSELLDRVAVDGLDLAAARSALATRRAARRRTRGTATAALVLVAAMGVSLWAVTRPPDPAEVRADAGPSSTTTTTVAGSSTSTSVADSDAADVLDAQEVPPTSIPLPPPVPAPAPAPVPPPGPAAAPTAAPPPPAPGTEGPGVPPGPSNMAMQVELASVSSPLRAGELARVVVAWLDPDHSGAPVAVSVDWGDPAVAAPAPEPYDDGPCDAAGGAAGATVPMEFRYATPGRHRVLVLVETCSGVGSHAERVLVESAIEVRPARVDGATAATAVLRAAASADRSPPLDHAVAVLVGPDGGRTTLGTRRPALAMASDGREATVVALPADRAGEIELTWEGSPCRATSRSEPVAAADVAVIDVAISC